MKIHLRTDVEIKPFRIFTTKQIPLHLQEEADKAIRKALDEGIICRENEPTEWCCRGGFVPKPNGTLRLITDFVPLNKYIQRPVHPFPSAMDIIQSVAPDSRVFAVLDCTMGYFQVPLDERSSKLTTFLLPQGRFRYRRAPMGLSASSDEFCRRSDVVLDGLDGVHKLVDDILVQAPSVDVLCARLKDLFERCRLHGLTLSKRKAQFYLGSDSKPVKFAGYNISSLGIRPDQDKFSALSEFPSPTNLTELRSFLGLANQFSSFVPDLAHITGKLRLLLRKGVAFLWTEEMEEDFQQAKKLLTSAHVIHPFDPALKTELITDASRAGLGFVLLQRNQAGRPFIIYCGSRALISAETRYAAIELECLGVVYALHKCNFYLRGLKSFNLITDHRPLLGIFNKSPQDINNPRLQRLVEKVAPYGFEVVWIAGKFNTIADALSRKPLFTGGEVADIFYISCSEDIHDVRLQSFKAHAAEDESYEQIVQALLHGKSPSSLPTLHPSRAFMDVWSRLSVEDGLLILDGSRIVPPRSQRQEILGKLHISHSGLVKTRKLAQLYFWPEMNNQIHMMIARGSACQRYLPSQSSEPQIHTVAFQAMDEVSLDLFACRGHQYLLMSDRFSGYLWVHLLSGQRSALVLDVLIAWFYSYGFPRTIRTDGGPQFRSEFDAFCQKYGIRHDTLSPLYPDANGHAEAGVKAAKYLLSKCLDTKESFPKALMEWRNTPREDGFSPAQLYFGRRQCTLLPCLGRHLEDVDKNEGHIAREAVSARKRDALRARTLAPLDVGQSVLLQDVLTKRWSKKGIIISVDAMEGHIGCVCLMEKFIGGTVNIFALLVPLFLLRLRIFHLYPRMKMMLSQAGLCGHGRHDLIIVIIVLMSGNEF